MDIQKELSVSNTPSRRKFVWGVGILSAFTAVASFARLPFITKKSMVTDASEGKKKTIKMLTQDGRLVEIDEALLTANRKKVTDIELQNWIKR